MYIYIYMYENLVKVAALLQQQVNRLHATLFLLPCLIRSLRPCIGTWG